MKQHESKALKTITGNETRLWKKLMNVRQNPTFIWNSQHWLHHLPRLVIYIYHQFFFFFGHVACKILILWPGIEPAYSAVKAQSPNNWTTREFPGVTKFKFISFSISMTLIMPFCCLKCHFLHKISFIRLKGQGKLELPLGTWLCSYNLKVC